MINFLICSLLLICIGCSDLSVHTQNSKSFVIKKDWVIQTTEKPFHEFRKINRMSPILIDDSTIIQGNAFDGIAAYNSNSGQIQWRNKIKNGVEANSLYYKGIIYVAGLDGNFYAIQSSNGQTKWSYSTSSENLGEPTLDTTSGIIYFLSGNNSLHSLDANSGKLVWHYQKTDASNFSVRGGSKPVINNKYIIVGFSDGSIACLDKKNGQLVWDKVLNKNKRFKDVDSDITLDGDHLLVAGYDDSLQSLNIENGMMNWKIDFGSFSGPTIDKNIILYPTTSSEVLALNKETGQIIWKYKLAEGIATKIQIYKNLAVFGESQGDLVFVDTATGKKINTFTPGMGILAAPTVDSKNNKVYFISGEANLYSLNVGWESDKWFSFLK